MNFYPQFRPQFHLGKPIAAMLILAAATSALIVMRKAPPKADMVVWTFADSHARSFTGDPSTTQPTLTDRFYQHTGQRVEVRLMSMPSLNLRLNAVFDRGPLTSDIPDLVEIEIGSVGRYFRPPLEHVGLLPLDSYLDRTGWRDRLLAQRLAPWTKEGVVFGIPHDVHPVTITFRDDLFREAGVDLAAMKTWPQFHEACLTFRDYWQARGVRQRYAIEASRNNTELTMLMLLQQHINLLDTNNKSYFTDPRVAKTLIFYAKMAAGPDAIIGSANPGPNVFASDFVAGNLAATITPDWRANYLQLYAQDAAGKARMMPLPVFDPSTDSPTGTQGGTMMGIPRLAKNPDLSWKLLEELYLTPAALEARGKTNQILPPVKTAWDDPAWNQPDSFYGGQNVGQLYIELAKVMPRREVTPYSGMAQAIFTLVQGRVIAEVEAGRLDTLETRTQQWLQEADDEIQRRIRFNSFDELVKKETD
jgi:arabinosaccharide transport system substrate-binding protein